MKTHTNGYKENVGLFGRELDSKITYELNGETIELGPEELNSISPNYEGSILKSVMKQLDIDSNVEIPIGTVINYQFGVKVEDSYEYIDFGNYIVKDIEKQEDTRSWKITCYDKILYFMKNYVQMPITYPITIRDYINAICSFNFITFANASDTFANYDKEIPNELYLDAEGADLGYTFRDVLDELAQVTASTICINEDDELEIRYITETNDTINESYLKDINVNFGEKYGPVNSIVLSRSGESDNIYLRDEESVAQDGLCEIKIFDNQIMNDNNRDEYLPDILEQLDGLEYYVNDFSSTGITYYDLCDRYNVEIDDTTYSCIMLNDEINITQGLEEIIHTEILEESETDYKKADKTDRKINQAYVIVDKQNQTITSLASQVEQSQELNDERILELTERTNSVEETITSTQETIEVIQREVVAGQETLKNALVTIDINGINVSTNTSAISTMMTNDTFIIRSGDTNLAYFGYDKNTQSTKAEMDNLTVTNYLVTGYHRIQTWEEPDMNEPRTGFFWIGE